MLFSLAMTADNSPSQVAPETKIDIPPPRVYRPEDIRHAPFTMRAEIKGKYFATDACLPVELNGHIRYLPIIPICDKTGKGIGKYFCWVDPHPDRNKDLANDGSVELAKLLMALPPEKTMVLSPPTGKSEHMTRGAVQLASRNRKFSEIIFKEALSEDSKIARDTSKLAIAERYFPVTAPEIGKVMGLTRVQVALIQGAPLDSFVKIDDIFSTGETSEKMGGMVQWSVSRIGKMINKDDIPTVALGIEVEDMLIRTGYTPRPNVYAAMVIPEITSSVIKLSSGSEIDLRELARQV